MGSEEVEKRLVAERNRRSGFNRSDFRKVQMMAWASLLSSALTSVLTASGIPDHARIFVALMAAVPALMIAAEGAFRYSVRYRLNNIAALDIDEMIVSLGKGQSPDDVYSKYLAYMREFEDRFPGVTVPSPSPSKV